MTNPDNTKINFATQTASFSTTLISNSTSNITEANIIDNGSKSESHTLSFFIVVLVILSIITSILIGVWLYGRRKRKWREFLAQLDNNTDWEYEQLEDGPTLHGSRATISPVFNMNISNDEIISSNNNSTQEANNSKQRNKINERTHIIN